MEVRMLTHGQLAQFEVFGFLVLRGLLRPEEIEKAGADFDVGLAPAREGMERFGMRGQLNWSSLRPETPFLASLLEDERFYGAAQQILGEDAVGYFSNANSFDGDRTEWHVDVVDPDWSGIKFGFYLQPLDRNSGALRLIPGSHREPLLSDLRKVALRESNEGTLDESGLSVEEVPAFAAESEPGDVILFDNHTWHASYGGGNHRRLCTLGYFASPKNASEDAAVRSMVVDDAKLAATFPHLARHPQWIADSQGHPVRGRWVETLREWGFIE
jgi:hypothetical protein